jgi:hypothetical protein
MREKARIREVRPSVRLPMQVGLGLVGVMLLAASAGSSAYAGSHKLTREEKKTLPLRGEQKIFVKNSKGTTIVVGRKGIRAITINATRFVRERDAETVEETMAGLTIDVDSDGSEVSIIASDREKDMSERGFWTFLRSIKYRSYIDITVEVPKRFDAKVSSASGDVQITSIDGNASVMGSSGEAFLKEIGGNVLVEVSSGDVIIRGVRGDAKVRLSSGTAKVEDIGGDCEVQATSGDIECFDVGGDASIFVSSGDFWIRGCRGSVNAKSGAGDGVISDFMGNLKAMSSSGDIRVTLSPIGEREYVLHTSSGDVVVAYDTPEQYGFKLDVNTSSGSIEGDLDITLDDISRRVLRGVVGTGKSRLIIETASGDIRISER